MTKTSLALLLLVLAKGKPAKTPPTTATAFDVTQYAVDLELDAESGAFTSKTAVAFTPQDSMDELVLDVRDLEVTKATLGGGDSGTELEPKLTPLPNGSSALHLKFPQALAAGASAVVHLTAKGHAAEGADEGLIKQPDPGHPGRVIYYTMFEPNGARRVFPCHDVPGDKAQFTLSVTTASDMQVLSNGAQVSDSPVEGDAKQHKVTYKLAHPNATYLLSIVVGNFEKADGAGEGAPSVGMFVPAGAKEQAQFPLEVTQKAAAFFSTFLQTPYPFERYDQVAIPGFVWNGMENTSLTNERASRLLPQDADSRSERNEMVRLIGHELAHQWFGDDVTPADWTEPWLSEAFATYLGWSSSADFTQNEASWIDAYLKLRRHYFPAEDGPRSRALSAHAATDEDGFDPISYLKGAQILRVLEVHLGRDTFRKGLAAYLSEHAYGNGKSSELFSALQKASGKDLSAFKKGWLDEAGYPVLRVAKEWHPGNKELVVSVKQRPNKAGSKALYQGTLTVVAHRNAEPSYHLEIPVILDKAEVGTAAELKDAPEWIDWNKGGIFPAKIEHNISNGELQAEALKDPDPVARLWALFELAGPLADAEKKAANPSGEALQTLATAIKTDHSPYVRAALMEELARGPAKTMPSPIDDAVIAQATAPQGLPDDPNGLAEVRTDAYALLGKVSNPAAQSLLSKGIKDTGVSYDTLRGVAMGLGHKGDANALKLLQDALETQGKRGIDYQRAVLVGLASSENEAAVPVLMSQVHAVHTNGELLQAISNNLRDSNALLHSAAFGNAFAAAVTELCGDKSISSEARARFLLLLDQLKSPAAKTALTKISKGDEPRLAALAKQTLAHNFGH
jgi:aminopeptidase N